MRPAHLIVFFMLALAVAVPAWAANSDPVQDAVAETIRKLDLQLTLPHQASDADQGESWHLHVPEGVLWIAAVGFAVILGYILLDMLPNWRARDEEGWGLTGAGAMLGGQSASASLAMADGLAAEARFVEAMHILLLHCLDEMKRRLRLDIADSLTSREILRRARLPEQATSALRGIVSRVESSYFGDHPATRPDYDACRGRYEELISILSEKPAGTSL